MNRTATSYLVHNKTVITPPNSKPTHLIAKPYLQPMHPVCRPLALCLNQ